MVVELYCFAILEAQGLQKGEQKKQTNETKIKANLQILYKHILLVDFFG